MAGPLALLLPALLLPALLLPALPACAPTVPLLAGGTTTPEGRGDVALGGAARVPYGELRQLEEPTLGPGLEPRRVQPGGVVPVVQGRLGVSRDVAIGLTVTGPQVAADVGVELWLDDTSSYRPALRLMPVIYGGALEKGQRLGGDLPLLLTLDVSSVIGLWMGPRAGIEAAFGDIEGQELDLLGLRAAGVVGISVGFRHVHALVELTAAYERWSGTVSAAGLALTPAFALRFRI